MNTLKVMCKPFDFKGEYQVDCINFVKQIVEFDVPEENLIFTYNLENIEWIDFGTNRWYPNGK